MATNIRSTALNFEDIKNDLKVHFLSKNEFADYDFEGAGLDNILDVLGYNTHYNGLLANFALNESFLKTAQLRSSILSLSEALGYTPRSKTAAVAYVNLTLNADVVPRPANITLPAGTPFTTTIDDIAYTFYTLVDYEGADDGTGIYTFTTSDGNLNIPIYEGSFQTRTFRVTDDDNEITYVIPDTDLDTSTATVIVYTSPSSSSYNVYLPLNEALAITSQSRLYSLRESPNGYYELSFSDGFTTGQSPAAGEYIVVNYIRTNGPDGNNGRRFSTTTTINIENEDYNISTVTSVVSSGGKEKESISSIRKNAPLGFASQNRLVTAQDYQTIILNKYSNFLDDVAAWGGEDNDPPDYGKVYISLKYSEGISEAVKSQVQTEITREVSDNIGIMSIDPVYVDAITTYLELSTFFNVNPSISSVTPAANESLVRSTITNYFNTNLIQFNKSFRRSLLLATIDDLSEAILNSRIDVKVNQRFAPTLNGRFNYTVSFPVVLSDPLPNNYVITSTAFYYQNRVCVLSNRLNSTILRVSAVDNGDILLNNAGSYTPSTGTVNIRGFAPQSIVAASNFIKVTALPANQSTIRPLRNYVLDIDLERSTVTSQIDYQQLRSKL